MMSADDRPCILICDSDLRYARHLQEYLLADGKIPCDVRIFTDPGRMRRCGIRAKALVTIVSESACGSWMEGEDPSGFLVLSETGRVPEGGAACVSKYQSARCLVDRILQMPSAAGLMEGASIRHGKPLEMIGFYTPVSRALQTTLSLTMGQILSAAEPVLYMNMEPCSGLEELLELSGKESLTDLIYYNECASERFPAMLGRMAETVNGLACLPPPRSFMELHAIRGDQWEALFGAIDRTSDYRYLVLDLSGQTDGLLDILRRCDRIYTLVREDPVSMARLSSFEGLLRQFHYEDISVKTERLRLPLFRELPASMKFLTHGALADYVRDLVREGEKQP